VTELGDQLLDGNLLVGSHMIDVEMLAGGDEAQYPVDKIVDIDKGSRLISRSLNWERDGTRHCVGKSMKATNELRDDMLVAHVRPVAIVGTKDDHPGEVLASIIDGQQFRNDLSAAIGIARIQYVWH
jgi:hypothetical protein